MLVLAEPDVQAAAEAARETPSRLGTKLFLERLEAAIHRASSADVPARRRQRDTSNV